MVISLMRVLLAEELLRGLSMKTGFKPEEIFRKYLWYLLRERKFDHAAVEDIVYLKATLGLNELQASPHLLGLSTLRNFKMRPRWARTELGGSLSVTLSCQRK